MAFAFKNTSEAWMQKLSSTFIKTSRKAADVWGQTHLNCTDTAKTSAAGWWVYIRKSFKKSWTWSLKKNRVWRSAGAFVPAEDKPAWWRFWCPLVQEQRSACVTAVCDECVMSVWAAYSPNMLLLKVCRNFQTFSELKGAGLGCKRANISEDLHFIFICVQTVFFRV